MRIIQNICAILCLVVSTVLFLGCAHFPTKEEAAAADYGPKLTDDQYIAKMKEAMELRLKDPDSAQYKVVSANKAYYPGGPVARFKTTTYGYTVKFLVNAKNSYGGYTGYSPYTVFFQGDKILVLEEGAN